MPFETTTRRRSVAAITVSLLLLLPAAAAQAVDAPPAPGQSAPAAASTETPAPAPASTLTISSDKSLVNPGKKLTGKIDGLVAGPAARVTLVATHVAGTSPEDLSCTVSATDAAGTFECTVPESQPEGTYRLVLNQKDAAGDERSASTEDVYILAANKYAPQITGPGLPIGPGTNPALMGTGYRPGGTVTVASSNGFFIPGGVADIDDKGNFGVSLRTSSFTPEGQYGITVTDDITGVKREISLYVLRATPTLTIADNTGIQGDYSTDVDGLGFAEGRYDGDLKLYAADGTTVVATLATGVAIADTKLTKTVVTIPAAIGQGLYQLAIVVPGHAETQEVRLAANWIAVFPLQNAVVPPAQGGTGGSVPPVMEPPAVVVPPVAETPVLPLLHQSGDARNRDPFALASASERQAPDLNATSPSLKADGTGNVSVDPTPKAQSAVPSLPQPGPDAAQVVQVKETQEVWPFVVVGLIAIMVGLAAGYMISRAQRGRST